MNIFSHITWRTMKQNRSRTIVTIIGVILSTAMIAAVTTFGASVQDFLIQETIRQEGNWHLEMGPIPTELSEKIKNDERAEAVGTIVSLGYAKAQGLGDEDKTPYFHIESYSEECMEMIPPEILEGRMPENDREILVPEFLVEMQKTEERISLGDTLTLSVGKRMQGGTELQTGDFYMSLDNPEITEEMLAELGGEETLQIEETVDFKVVGTYYQSRLNSFMSVAAYELIVGPTEKAASSCETVIRLKSVWDVEKFEQELLEEDILGVSYSQNTSLLRWQGVNSNDNFLIVIGGLLGIVIVLIMAASISLIYNAFSISMRERTGQFGMLSSVGATKKQLRKTLQFEAWIVCLLGIPLGILSGVAGIGITLYFLGPMMAKWMYGIESTIPLKISGPALLAAVVTAFLTVQISAWLPARRMKKISPLEAIRASRDIVTAPGKRKKNRIAEKCFGLEGMLAARNYQRDKRKYRTTVVSLTLSIVLFVTAGSFVLYLGKAGQDVFEASEVDISIDNNGPEEWDSESLKKIKDELMQVEGLDEGYRYRRGYYAMRVDSDQVPEGMEYLFSQTEDGDWLNGCHLYVLPDEQFADYAKEAGINPEKYLNQDEMKAIYKKNCRQYDGRTGKYSTVDTLQNEKGKSFEIGDSEAMMEETEEFGVMKNAFRIIAMESVEVYPRSSIESYYSSSISFFVPESTFERAADGMNKERMRTYFSIISGDYKKVYKEILEKTEDETSALYGMGVINMREGEEQMENIQTVIQVLTTGFVVLMSLIAVANIFNTVSTNLYLRRREFAMLRSAGMTQRGFRKMMGCECLIYGLRSIFYGVILSAGSSYLVYLVLQSGVEFSYRLPWMYWLISIAAVLLVVGITMIYTMGKMRRDNVIDVLKQNG